MFRLNYATLQQRYCIWFPVQFDILNKSYHHYGYLHYVIMVTYVVSVWLLKLCHYIQSNKSTLWLLTLCQYGYLNCVILSNLIDQHNGYLHCVIMVTYIVSLYPI